MLPPAMNKLWPLLLVIVLCAGREAVWIVPPASGRITDARSGQPISHATVIRVCTNAAAKTITRSDGSFKFHGRWRLEVALGDALCAPHSYLIKAEGYETVSTNCFPFGWASQSSLRDNLGEIRLSRSNYEK